MGRSCPCVEFKYKKRKDGTYTVGSVVDRSDLRSSICEITKEVEKIFGKGIVKKAYIKCDIYADFDTERDFREYLEDIIKKTLGYVDDKKNMELVLDSHDLIIEFVNGTVINMTNSEWCCIRQMKSLEYALSGRQLGV